VVDLDSAKYSGMSDVELVEDRGCEHHELPIACLMAEAAYVGGGSNLVIY